MSAELIIAAPGQPERKIALHPNLTIGRGRGNDVDLGDPRASRSHALIRLVGSKRYYLFDLGSANGTFLNGRALLAPALLATGDEIRIAGCLLRFADAEGAPELNGHSTVELSTRTAVEMVHETVAILVVDVRGYTRLSEALGPKDLTRLIGTWFQEAAASIEQHNGAIDKFIGDAVLAFWPRAKGKKNQEHVHLPLHAAESLVELAARYHERISSVRPELGFGIGCAVHVGEVVFSNIGLAARRDFTAVGDCVNVAFRLESLCKELGRPILVSRDVRDAVGGAFHFEDIGPRPVKGKSEQVHVYALTGTA
jgi:adenylate cyclase